MRKLLPMAAASNSPLLLLFTCFLFFFTILTSKSHAEEAAHHHVAQISTLLPESVCNPSIKEGGNKRGSLKVVYRHGPCSKLNQDKEKPVSVEEILSHDQSRVNSINSRLAFDSRNKDLQDNKVTLPAKPGSIIGSANYIVTVGLGTPKKDLSLTFDTGSDLTWTQCKGCISLKTCYPQKDDIFDPSLSSSYSNISCTSPECSELRSATSIQPRCSSSSTCVYAIQYGDGSFSVGFFGKEKLTLTSTDVVDGFLFGCGQDNEGLFRGAAGLIGLGRDKVSIVSQTATKYGKIFFYCLPSSASSDGYLSFGSSGIPSNVQYTPLSTNGDSFYGIEVLAIYVGGSKLAIDPTVFSTAGTIIDSGTVITRLPPAAYSALSSAFRAQMTKYPMTKPFSLLDTCYDFSNFPNIIIPLVSFEFGGNVKVDIPLQGTLLGSGINQLCLAFAANQGASDIGIFGNVQQKTFGVVYNVEGGKLGFAPGGCS